MTGVTELRLAALSHAVECYDGPNDDTIPVLLHWIEEMRSEIDQ